VGPKANLDVLEKKKKLNLLFGKEIRTEVKLSCAISI
jgi:hypothetical protein